MDLEALESGVWNEDVLASVLKTTYDFGVGQSKDSHFKM